MHPTGNLGGADSDRGSCDEARRKRPYGQSTEQVAPPTGGVLKSEIGHWPTLNVPGIDPERQHERGGHQGVAQRPLEQRNVRRIEGKYGQVRGYGCDHKEYR